MILGLEESMKLVIYSHALKVGGFHHLFYPIPIRKKGGLLGGYALQSSGMLTTLMFLKCLGEAGLRVEPKITLNFVFNLTWIHVSERMGMLK